MNKVNEFENLEKELITLKEKVISFETNRISEEHLRNAYLEEIINKTRSSDEEIHNLSEQLQSLDKEYQILLEKEDNSGQSLIESKLIILEDLKKRNDIVFSEVNNINLRCEQFNDLNFIYHCLSSWDVFYLNKFMNDLNNCIHEK